MPSTMLAKAYNSISNWKSYNTSPLLTLDKLKNDLKVKNIFY